MLNQETIDRLRTTAIGAQSLFIGGKDVAAAGGAQIDVVSPIDGKPFARIASAAVDDVDRAVAAARKAFESGSWSRATPAFRKKVLLKLSALIEQNAGELAVLGVR